MKKTMWSIAVLMATLILATSEKEAYPKDAYGTQYPAVWRSSSSCGGVNFALLSSGTVIVNKIIIGSPTINSESWISLYNSSSPAIATGNMNVATGTHINTYSHITRPTPSGHSVEYNVSYSSGVVVNAEGLACREILWNYPVSQGITYNHTVILRP